MNGANDQEGRVEIYYGGEWGTVCNDNWDYEDAKVVCRMLGYSGAEGAVQQNTFGAGRGRIILDDVECTGDEKSILECPASERYQNNCGHDEDAGVICTGQSNVTFSVKVQRSWGNELCLEMQFFV